MKNAHAYFNEGVKYFQLNEFQVGVSNNNDYNQIKERILGFGNVQAGISWKLSQKWNQRFGIGYKINYSEITSSPSPLSSTTNYLPPTTTTTPTTTIVIV